MCIHGDVCRRAAFSVQISSERGFLHAAVDSGFLKSFKRRRLSVGQTRLDASLRECPSAAAGLYQQELNAVWPDTVADSRDLFAFLQAAKMCQTEEFRRRPC